MTGEVEAGGVVYNFRGDAGGFRRAAGEVRQALGEMRRDAQAFGQQATSATDKAEVGFADLQGELRAVLVTLNRMEDGQGRFNRAMLRGTAIMRDEVRQIREATAAHRALAGAKQQSDGTGSVRPASRGDRLLSGSALSDGVMGGLIGGVAGGAAVMAVGAAENAARGAVSTIVEMERLRAQLETVTGSVQAAGEAFGVLQKFAVATPYSLQEVVTAFTKLKAMGLDPSIEALTAYGNTASSMGKSLDQMIEAVADAATGEFERLKEFGIRARAQGDEVAFTFRGVTTTVANNSAAIEGYLKRLGEVEFAGGMERQAKTLGGTLANLGDSFTNLADVIGRAGVTELLASMARGLTEVNNEAAKLIELLAPLGDQSLAAIEEQIANAQAAIEKVRTWPGSETFVANQEETIRKLRTELMRRAIEGGGKPAGVTRDDWLNPTPEITVTGRPDPLAGLDDDFEVRLRQMIADAASSGLEIGITSGLRSTERQAELWAEALKKYGSPEEARKWVAPPGSSQHEKGTAADLSFGSEAARQFAHDNAGVYGLTFPLGNEPWHIEPASARGSATGRDAGADAAKRQAEAIEKLFASYSRETEMLGAEAEASKLSTAERVKMLETLRLENELRAQGVTDLEPYRAAIEAEANARAQLVAMIERQGEAATAAKEAYGFLAESATSGITSVITGASTAEDAIRRLTSALVEASMQALLLGQGPLAGLFGTGKSGGLFGIIGAAMGIPAAAGGGEVRGSGTGTSDSILTRLSNGEFVVNAKETAANRDVLEAINSGRVRRFAEGGAVGRATRSSIVLPSMPALRMPDFGGQADGRTGGAQAMAIRVSVDLSGANGDDAIMRAAEWAARKGAADGAALALKAAPARMRRNQQNGR